MRRMIYFSLFALNVSLAGCKTGETMDATEARATTPTTPVEFNKERVGTGCKYTPARFKENNGVQRFVVNGENGKKLLIGVALFNKKFSKVLIWDEFNEENLDPIQNAVFSASRGVKFSGSKVESGKPGFFAAETTEVDTGKGKVVVKFHYSNYSSEGGIYTVDRIEFWLNKIKMPDSNPSSSWEDVANQKTPEC